MSLILIRVSNPNDAPPGVGTSYVCILSHYGHQGMHSVPYMATWQKTRKQKAKPPVPETSPVMLSINMKKNITPACVCLLYYQTVRGLLIYLFTSFCVQLISKIKIFPGSKPLLFYVYHLTLQIFVSNIIYIKQFFF